MQRNKFTHELTDYIFYNEIKEDYIKLLNDLINMYEDLDNWYFLNFEAPVLGISTENIEGNVETVNISLLKKIIIKIFNVE